MRNNPFSKFLDRPYHHFQILIYPCCLFMIVSLLISSKICFCHHGPIIARPSIQPSSPKKQFATSRWSAFMGIDWGLWHTKGASRTKRSKIDLGTMHTLLFNMSGAFELNEVLSTKLSIPFGIFKREFEGEKIYSSGLSDGSVSLTYNSFPYESLEKKRSKPFQFSFSAGMTFPSGEYKVDTALSASELVASADGELKFNSYIAQTSLGAGVWKLSLDSDFNYQFSTQWLATLSILSLFPVGETRDGIEWGEDLNVSSSLAFKKTNLFSINTGFSFLKHFSDRLPSIITAQNNDNMVSKDLKTDLGGNEQLSLFVKLGYYILKKRSCSLQVDLPFWQNVKVP